MGFSEDALWLTRLVNNEIVDYVDSDLPFDCFIQPGPLNVPSQRMLATTAFRRPLQSPALAMGHDNSSNDWLKVGVEDLPGQFYDRNSKTDAEREEVGCEDVAGNRSEEKHGDKLKKRKRKIEELDNRTHGEWANKSFLKLSQRRSPENQEDSYKSASRPCRSRAQ